MKKIYKITIILLFFFFILNLNSISLAKKIISIKSCLYDIIADQIRPYIYVSDSDNNTVLFINSETDTLEKSIFVGLVPAGMDISFDNSKLFIALSGSNSIGIVDLETQTLVDTIPISGSNNPANLVCGRNGQRFI